MSNTLTYSLCPSNTCVLTINTGHLQDDPRLLISPLLVRIRCRPRKKNKERERERSLSLSDTRHQSEPLNFPLICFYFITNVSVLVRVDLTGTRGPREAALRNSKEWNKSRCRRKCQNLRNTWLQRGMCKSLPVVHQFVSFPSCVFFTIRLCVCSSTFFVLAAHHISPFASCVIIPRWYSSPFLSSHDPLFPSVTVTNWNNKSSHLFLWWTFLFQILNTDGLSS